MYNSRKWLMPDIDCNKALRISENLNVSPLAASILCARGFSYEDAKDFLNTDESSFHDPFLLNDMQKAVDRINVAVEQNEKIAVYGDYDVDGITSTYILFDYLKMLGADVTYYIPDRINEGYGINCSAVDTLKSGDVTLIITVDVGITATKEVDYAASLGIDVIVTDHHALKDTLPDAVAVINPKISKAGYPFDSLAGVGVAFKLIYAHSGLDKKIFDRYCDIVAIGTIADMVPLCDENRFIAAVGIEKLKNTSNSGIKAIMTVAGLKKDEISSSDISFAIAPRLNAAGRMTRAEDSVELLLETDDKKAFIRAEELDECNKKRQKEEQKIFDECIEIIEKRRLFDDNFILVAKEGWAHGIIGIVSSKITERFYKPSAVVSINADGSGKASGRSIKGINLFEALSTCSDYLTKFGGHELAAGFSLKEENIDFFHKQINSFIAPLLTEEVKTPSIEIDSVISLSDININSAQSLLVLEPYGIENRPPVLCVEDVRIEAVRYTQNQKHAFVTISKDDVKREIPAFSMADVIKTFTVGDYISVVGTLGTNSFRGNTQAQFIMRDIKYSPVNKFLTRDELKIVFADIITKIEDDTCFLKNDMLISTDSFRKVRVLNPKIQTALMVFEELGIFGISASDEGYCVTKGYNFESKTNLSDSLTFTKYGI